MASDVVIDRRCVMADARYVDWLRRWMDREEPGWTSDRVFCPAHQEDHELLPAEGQRPLGQRLDDPAVARGKRREVVGRPIEGPKGSGKTVLCFHETTAEPVFGPCAYCRAWLHTHQSILGGARSGRLGGYVEERCPACHRWCRVYPHEDRKRVVVRRAGEMARQPELGVM